MGSERARLTRVYEKRQKYRRRERRRGSTREGLCVLVTSFGESPRFSSPPLVEVRVLVDGAKRGGARVEREREGCEDCCGGGGRVALVRLGEVL